MTSALATSLRAGAQVAKEGADAGSGVGNRAAKDALEAQKRGSQAHGADDADDDLDGFCAVTGLVNEEVLEHGCIPFW